VKAIPKRELTSAEEALRSALPDGELRTLFGETGLPNRRVEAWRWSDLRAALRDVKAPAEAFGRDLPRSRVAELATSVCTLGNGRLLTTTHDCFEVSPPEPTLWADMPVASLATAAPVHRATLSDGEVLLVRHGADGNGSAHQRLHLSIADAAQVTVIEEFDLTDQPFLNLLTEIEIGAGSRLRRIVAQDAAPDSILVHSSRLTLTAGARVEQTTVSGGAAFARHETRLVQERDGQVRIDGLYDLRGALHCDMTSLVVHDVPGTRTEQLCKGVVRDTARGVFQGKFAVAREAQKTDARMAHHALMLSDRASVQAKPELEIYADDVECAHGNTVGALDTDAMFYMRQRGLSEDEARSILIEAFLGEVLERIDDDALRAALAGAEDLSASDDDNRTSDNGSSV
jgi:Fe-S cluster assembly protein SufD